MTRVGDLQRSSNAKKEPRTSLYGIVACLFVCVLLLYASETVGQDYGVGSSNLFAAAVLSPQEYVVVGDRGRIFLSRDGGSTWQRIQSGTSQPLGDVCFVDRTHGWACGQAGVVLHSSDGGATWHVQHSHVDEYLLALDFVDTRHGFVVGTDSTVLRTVDGGATWQQCVLRPRTSVPSADEAEEGEALNLFAVVMMDREHICIAGEKGRIFVSEDGGQTWYEADSPLYDRATDQGRIMYSLAYDNGTLYGVGVDAAFVYSKDGGRTWSEGQLGLSQPECYAVEMIGGLGYVVGSGGYVLTTLDGGKTWKTIPVPERVTQCWLSGVALAKTGRGTGGAGVIVGQHGTIGRIIEDDVTWQVGP